MSSKGVVDATIHQWTVDLSEMKDLVPERWQQRLATKSMIQDPVSGTLMPTIPWYHAYWNEDAKDYEREDPDQWTNSERYSSPELLEETLAEQGVETAILTGHEMRFLPALLNAEYQTAIASSYNQLLKKRWLADSDRLKGGILVSMSDPEGAVAEIERYAADPDMVTVLVYGGHELPLGHHIHHPVYEAAQDAGLPITIHTSGNPVHRQTAMGLPAYFATHDINLAQNHMTNAISLVFERVFDMYPDLQIVWSGQGTEWVLQTKWRSTRYYRNIEEQAPDIDKEPWEYMQDNFSFTTYPMGRMDPEHQHSLWRMAGIDNVIYASGYPDWNSDTPTDLPDLPEEDKDKILRENAERVYNL